MVDLLAYARGVQRAAEGEDFAEQGGSLVVGHHCGEPGLRIGQFGGGVLG